MSFKSQPNLETIANRPQVSTMYEVPQYADSYSSSYPITQDVEYQVPFITGKTSRYTAIGVTVNAAGGAGSLIRLGIRENYQGRPGNLVLDAGTVDGTIVAHQDIVTPITLAPRSLYWLCCVGQINVATMRISSFIPAYGYTPRTTPILYSGGFYTVIASGPLPFTNVFVGTQVFSHILLLSLRSA